MFGRGWWFGRNPAKKGLTITFLLSDGRPSYPNLIGIDKRDGGRRTMRQDYVECITRVPLDADDAEHLARPGLRRCVTTWRVEFSQLSIRCVLRSNQVVVYLAGKGNKDRVTFYRR